MARVERERAGKRMSGWGGMRLRRSGVCGVYLGEPWFGGESSVRRPNKSIVVFYSTSSSLTFVGFFISLMGSFPRVILRSCLVELWLRKK